jgi:hypothetical protein
MLGISLVAEQLMAFQELDSMQLWFMEAMFGVQASGESTENKESSIHKETCQ